MKTKEVGMQTKMLKQMLAQVEGMEEVRPASSYRPFPLVLVPRPIEPCHLNSCHCHGSTLSACH